MDQMTVGQPRSRLMVIDYDHLEPESLGEGHLVGVVDPAVHRDENGGTLRDDRLHRLARKAVALLEAAGQIPIDICPQLGQDASCRRAVAVMPSAS